MTNSVYLPPWRIDVEHRENVTLPTPKAVLARAISRALDAAGAPSPASMGLILTDDREIAQLNAAHLGEPGPTDVLSFPLLPPEAYPDHPGKVPSRGSLPFALPPGRRPHLGDVVGRGARIESASNEGSVRPAGHLA